MYRNILLPQLKRAPWRTALFLVLLAIVTAFFCLSANLYRNTNHNIASAGDAFSTVAYLEFFQAITEKGERVAITDEGYIGTFPVTIDDLDMDVLKSLPGVKSVDLRPILGGYIPGAVSRYELNNPTFGDGFSTGKRGWVSFPGALIRFTIQSQTPLLDQEQGYGVQVQVEEILGGAMTFSKDAVRRLHMQRKPQTSLQKEQKLQLNRGQDLGDSCLLEPGVEYLAAVYCNEFGSESLRPSNLWATYDFYDAEFQLDYGTWSVSMRDQNGVLVKLFETPIFPRTMASVSEEQPFWLWRWEDVQNDPEIKAYFEAVAQAYDYSACSYAVMPTHDLNGIPCFYQKILQIKDGREFTAEDYETGNRVCIVGAELAEIQGWKVGDTIDLSLYQCNQLVEGGNQGTLYEGHFLAYTKDNGGFFDQGEYTIVGIWGEMESSVKGSLHNYTTNMEYNTIIVPSSSVQNLDSVGAPASGSRLTVHLENGTMEEFLEAASKVTLSESADEVRITAFDQGYSQAQDSLQSMLGTAQFLLVLSSVLLVVAGVLLAFFYTQSQKHNMALMRLLGCNRRQAGTMTMLGSLLILLPGGIFGTVAGHLLTDRVASTILNGTSTLDKPEYAGFREIFGVQAEANFALSAQTSVSAVALAVAAGLFLLGCIGFTLLLLRKEPREALADK